MATWLECRQEILSLLDVDVNASTSDDLRNLVDIRMRRQRDKLLLLKPPLSLETLAPVTVTVTNTTSFIPIGTDALDSGSVNQPGFHVADFWRLSSFRINDFDVPMVGWRSWQRTNSLNLGRQRDVRSATISPQNYIYLGWLPSTSTDSWSATLYYFKQASSMTDGGILEIPDEHMDALTLGVVTKFPHLFQSEERLMIFQGYQKESAQALQAYLQDKDQKSLRKDLRMRPAQRRRSPDNFYLVWGTWNDAEGV